MVQLVGSRPDYSSAPPVFALVYGVDSSAMWRIMQPFAVLRDKGYPCAWDWTESASSGIEAMASELVILPRATWKSPKGERRFFDMLHALGITTVYEADDDLFSSKIFMEAAWSDKERNEWPTTVSRTRRALKKAKAVTVSNARLRTRVFEFIHDDVPVEIIPNMIDLRWWFDVLSVTERTIDGLTVGWVGARRNWRDLATMLPAWKVIAERFPDVTFVTAGHEFELVGKYVPDSRWKHVPWMPLREYPAAYKQVDIGCAPLASTQFNRCKSHIKVLEFAAGGAAVVASDTIYADYFSEESGLLIARSEQDWIDYLTLLIEDEHERQDRASSLLRCVFHEHSLEQNYQKIIAAWARLRAATLSQHTVLSTANG